MSRKCPALQGRPGRSQKGPKSRYSVNLEMAKAVYSNTWCSHSSRFRCVHVLWLSCTHFVTSHSSLCQALCQWRTEKASGRRVGSGREKGEIRRDLLFSPGSRSPLIPLFARSLFRSSSLTESLEQANHIGVDTFHRSFMSK